MFSKKLRPANGRSAPALVGEPGPSGHGGRPLRRGQAVQAVQAGEDVLSWVQLTRRGRGLRNEMFDATLFADPAWDILLALYEAHLDGRQATVGDACVASNVPIPTARRQVSILQGRGLLSVVGGSDDDAGVVELSEGAKTSMRSMFVNLRMVADKLAGPATGE